MPKRPGESAERRRFGIKHGFRSGLEEANAELLEQHGLPVIYEAFQIPYQIERTAKYKPDFVLPNGIVIETKGRFTPKDRVKHLLVSAQHPLIDIRFVFSNPRAKLSKVSKTTNGEWCDKKGFQFARELIPVAWMEEPRNERSIAELRELGVEL